MTASPNTLKIAEQALAAHRVKLATTANKDQVRRSIRAMEDRIAGIRAELATQV